MTDERNLSEIIESPRAIKALERAGYKTVKDLDGVPMKELLVIKGVGQRTIELIEKIGLEQPAEEDPDFDEGPHPINLLSPHGRYGLIMLHGDEIVSGRSRRVVPPLAIEFMDGRAQLKREKWFLFKFNRDKVEAEKAAAEEQPWRLDAIAWLKARANYNRTFHIMSD